MDVTKVVENVAEAVGEELKNETKEKLSKIWRNVIIFSFLLNIVFIVATVRAIGERTDIATELVGVKQQLADAKTGSEQLEKQIADLRLDLIRAGADIVKLESDNKKLQSENKGAIGNTANIESITRDSERIIQDSIKLLREVGETKQDTEN